MTMTMTIVIKIKRVHKSPLQSYHLLKTSQCITGHLLLFITMKSGFIQIEKIRDPRRRKRNKRL